MGAVCGNLLERRISELVGFRWAVALETKSRRYPQSVLFVTVFGAILASNGRAWSAGISAEFDGCSLPGVEFVPYVAVITRLTT